MMLVRQLAALLIASQCFAACVAVDGSRILGRDLAQADPQFAGLPSALVVGFVPAPGARRVFTPAELERIARQNGLQPANPQALCFELRMRTIGENEIRPAMMRVLPAGAEIQFADAPSFHVPAGEVLFPADGLEPAQPGTNGARVWRGYVTYGEKLRMTIAPRVVVTIHATAAIADRDLPAGEPVSASALHETAVAVDLAPMGRIRSGTVEDIAGKVPKHRIQAGTAVSLDDVTEPPCVKAGDRIRVEVNSGFAHLGFDAAVQAPARQGDIIELKNPISGKPFRARLVSSSSAVVLVGPAWKDGAESK